MLDHVLGPRDHRPIRRANSLFRLDWREFWLLSAVLGGMIGLLAMVMLPYYSSR